MYDIYIKNYLNASGTVSTNETLMYSIPITSSYQNSVVIDPVLNCEMGKTGSFEFSIRQNNPYYSCWQQMRTIIRIVYDGTTIFRGRALTIDNTLDGSKKLHFEGDLAFLLDTHQPGTKEENRTEITILAYLRQLIDKHNSEMNDNPQADKNDHKFTLGNVPGQYASNITTEMRVKTDATKKFGTDSRTSTMSALEELQNEYGGYFRTRYVNGTVYLDWLDSWFNPIINSQPIEISDNLIDLSNNAEVDNIFTAVVPVGASKGEDVTIEGYKEDVHGHNDRILVPQIVSQFSDSELNSGYHTKSDYQNAVNKYGIIYKVQKFENADTKEKLWTYCLDWIKNNYVGSVISYTLTAIDMHHLNGYVQKYLVGDRITLVYPDPDRMVNDPGATIEKNVTVISITYNLHNPEKNQYTVGTPNNLIQKKYGSANSSKGSSGGGGHDNNDDEKRLEEYNVKMQDASRTAWRYIIDNKTNVEEYNKIVEEFGPEAGAAAQKMTHTAWVRGVAMREDPDREFTDLSTSIPAISTDAATASIKIAGYLDPKFAGKLIEQNKLTMSTVESIVLDGLVGTMSVKEKLEYNLGPVTDEYLANYIVHNQENPRNNAIVLGLEEVSGPPGISTYEKFKSGRLELLKNGKLISPNDPAGIYDTDPTQKNTLTLKGLDGSSNQILTINGLDGTGDLPTTITDGINSVQTFFDPDSVEDGSDPVSMLINDGRDGSVVCGEIDDPNKPPATINKTITYIGSDGKTHTIEGAIKAVDFYDTTIGSVNDKFIEVDDLVVNHSALIANLEAGVANIRELFSEYAKITNLSSHISEIDVISGKSAVFSGNVNVSGRLIAGTLFLGGTESAQNVSSAIKSITRTSAENATRITLEVLHFNGTKEDLTFERAAVPNLTGSWSSGTLKIMDVSDPDSTPYYQASVSQGTITQDPDNPNYYSGPIVYSATGQSTYNTGATYFIDATSRYNAGRNSIKTMEPTNLGIGQQGKSLGTLSGVSPGRVVHFKVGDTFYYFLCT